MVKLLFTLIGSNEAALHSLSLPVTIRSVCRAIPLWSQICITNHLPGPPPYRTEPSVKIAFKLSLLASQNNFVCFFRLFPHLPPLGKCAVYPHLHTLCRLDSWNIHHWGCFFIPDCHYRCGLQTLCNAYCVGSKPSAFPLRYRCVVNSGAYSMCLL